MIYVCIHTCIHDTYECVCDTCVYIRTYMNVCEHVRVRRRVLRNDLLFVDIRIKCLVCCVSTKRFVYSCIQGRPISYFFFPLSVSRALSLSFLHSLSPTRAISNSLPLSSYPSRSSAFSAPPPLPLSRPHCVQRACDVPVHSRACVCVFAYALGSFCVSACVCAGG